VTTGGNGFGVRDALGLVAKAGGVVAGFFKEGGMAERPSKVGIVPADLFRSAPRFQAGGDVIPAMLRPGERALTPEENQQGRARSIQVNFNISTPDVAGFNNSRGQIEARMAQSLRRASERNN
jgi:hypothetical protein